MNLLETYRVLDRYVSSVDFAALWPGFQRIKFAVYDEKECVLDGQKVEKTADFCANTAIEYRGETVAIWQMSGENVDGAVLASKIIHEMFHGFQTLSGETRYPDELEALRSYRYSAENLSIKLDEGQLTAELLENYRAEGLSRLLALRALRRERFPGEFDYEGRVEQIEGSARFVELAALGQLSPEKAGKAWKRLGQTIARPESYFPVRAACYDVGAALFRLLMEHTGLDVRGFSPWPEMEAALEGVAPCDPPAPRPDVRVCLEAYQAETRRVVTQALARNEIALEGPIPLLSVNTYDARRLGPYVTSTYFVLLGSRENPTLLSGDFVVEISGSTALRVYAQDKS